MAEFATRLYDTRSKTNLSERLDLPPDSWIALNWKILV